MIVPMKKVSLVVFDSEKKQVLKKLRRLGLLHIETLPGTGPRLLELQKKTSVLEEAISVLGELKIKAQSDKALTDVEALDLAEKTVSLAQTKKACMNEISYHKSELEKLREWGETDSEQINELLQKGVGIQFYEMPASEYNALDTKAPIIVLKRTKQTVRFLTAKISDEPLDIPDTASRYLLTPPDITAVETEEKILSAESRINSINSELKELASMTAGLKKAVLSIQKDIEFEGYQSGMSGMCLDEDKKIELSSIQGYIPTDNLDVIKKSAKENSWGLLVEDPTPDDNVPTKLSNNKFVSLIYPLTDFIGTVPGYFEYDISAWFLGFILLFFGIIFGDGGYGLVISAIAGLMILNAKLKNKKVPAAYLLILLMGAATVLWGVFTCTWFGLDPNLLPEWLKNISIPVISNVYTDKIWYPFWTNGDVGLTTAQNLQILCFSLALIQLTAAHIKGMIRNRKSLKCLGDLGTIVQLFGIFYIVLSFVVNGAVFSFGLVISGIPIGTVAIILVAVGFALSFIFSNYDGSIGKSVLESLKNIVSVLLGVVNVFSDIVSYIRLWAVGMAGAAISATVNELASPMLGNFMFMIIAIVLLVFGHGLNMILNVLSVIVHGVRLNTLEFSSHLDMSWSGHKFKPFEE